MQRGEHLSKSITLPQYSVYFRKNSKPERAGIIPGDIEAIEGGAASDAYVVIRRKSKENGDSSESNGTKH